MSRACDCEFKGMTTPLPPRSKPIFRSKIGEETSRELPTHPTHAQTYFDKDKGILFVKADGLWRQAFRPKDLKW